LTIIFFAESPVVEASTIADVFSTLLQVEEDIKLAEEEEIARPYFQPIGGELARLFKMATF